MAESEPQNPMSETEAANEIMQRIRSKMQESQGDGQAASESQGTQSFERAMERIGQQLKNTPLPTAVQTDTLDAFSTCFTIAPQDASQLEAETSSALTAHRQFGELNPRLPGPQNRVIQLGKKIMRRSLTWYTRPLHLFQGAVIRAFQQVTAVLQAHDEGLQRITQKVAGQSSVAQELCQQNNRMVEQMAAQRVAILAIAEELFQAGGRFDASATGQSGGSQLLKENKKIVSYWDRAAEGDALRETVSQGAKESDEEYLNNWVRIGEYVAGKIMSYSCPNPVALEIGPGMGRISVPMSRYCKSITALDISPEMVRQARQTLKELTALRSAAHHRRRLEFSSQ